ncbi:MAG: hypothetical protein U0736_25160 [Gemmataceae bacterium]
MEFEWEDEMPGDDFRTIRGVVRGKYAARFLSRRGREPLVIGEGGIRMADYNLTARVRERCSS